MQKPAATDVDIISRQQDPSVPGQVIVELNPGYSIGEVAAMYGLNPTPIQQITSGVPPTTRYLMSIIDGSNVDQKVAVLTADTLRVLQAEPNFTQGAPEAARPTWSIGDSFGMVPAGRKMYGAQWSTKMLRLDEAHQLTRGATSANVPVVVAVLDTGIDLNQQAFAGRLVQGYDFVDNDDNPSEEGNPQLGPYGHGTHVAGLIAMVAPEAKIMPIRVLGVDGRGNAFTLAAAVKYAVDHGANVINLSLSTAFPMDVVRKAFYDVLDGTDNVQLSGAVAVIAAGNEGNTALQYPAAVTQDNRSGRCIVSVAASTSDDALTSFSSRGAWVSVMAPGERMISPVPYNHYGTWAGTSMAAPIVAGEAALIRARYPNAEPKRVVEQIKAKVVFISGQPGRINIISALATAPPHS